MVSGPMPVSEISVVLIGRNEGERLASALRSIVGKVKRIVYVDSASTDGSIETARKAGAQIVQLDMAKPFTAARARNAGFAELLRQEPNLDLVQFVDGDCSLDEHWLETTSDFLAAHPEVALVCGRRRERFPERTIFNRMCDIEWDTPIGVTHQSGGDFLVRRKAFEEVGGFAEHMIAGEEPELCARLRYAGWKIWRLDAEMTVHDADIRQPQQWWRRAVRAGYAYASLAHAHGKGPDHHSMRSVKSALIWGAGLPLLIAGGALAYPPVIAVAAVYPAQALRIGLRKRHLGAYAPVYGGFIVLGKFAEAIGIAKFARARLRGREHALIEYK